jgi:hypothetical protein
MFVYFSFIDAKKEHEQRKAVNLKLALEKLDQLMGIMN